jgi:hypothetical protein
VNPGGEPERDDPGLPPVDIEIPDDARDLDRDVQAYRRELRALRRSERRGRWHRSLSKDGVVLPLLACCLILALITGTLLTVFTATSDQSLTGSNTSGPAGIGAPVPTMTPNQALPANTKIVVDDESIAVRTFGKVMLVLVPAGCRCMATFRWLAEVAVNAGVPAFALYTPGTRDEVQELLGQLDGSQRDTVRLAEETGNQLSRAAVSADVPPGQLTAILATPGKNAAENAIWVTNMSPSENAVPMLRILTGQSP